MFNYSCFDNGTSGIGNIAVDPNFAYADPNLYNYHLSEGSDCINAGNNAYVIAGQTDIDGEDRIYNSTVDMGADEYTCSEVYNKMDFNADGIVNLNELNEFSLSWLSHDPNEPGLTDPNLWAGWNASCNLDTAGTSKYRIDLYDLAAAADEWLWVACWKQSQFEIMLVMMDGIEGMAMEGSEIMSTSNISSLSAEVSTSFNVSEPTTEKQIDNIQEILTFLDELWKDKEIRQDISKQQWKEFISSLETSLYELESSL